MLSWGQKLTNLTHIFQDYFTGSGINIWLSHCQWNIPDLHESYQSGTKHELTVFISLAICNNLCITYIIKWYIMIMKIISKQYLASCKINYYPAMLYSRFVVWLSGCYAQHNNAAESNCSCNMYEDMKLRSKAHYNAARLPWLCIWEYRKCQSAEVIWKNLPLKMLSARY